MKQMSDGVDVMKNMPRAPGVNYPVLVPNLKGYEIAVRSCLLVICLSRIVLLSIMPCCLTFILLGIFYLFIAMFSRRKCTVSAMARKVFGFPRDLRYINLSRHHRNIS